MTTEPRGRRIEHVVRIAAPAGRVWDILSDLPGWHRWNPLMPAASGILQAGRMLDVSVALPGFRPQATRPVVTAVEPGRALRYETVQSGGQMRGRRYFTIAPDGPAACTVTNGEVLGGVIGRLVAMLLGKRIALGMSRMNAALKAEAEQGG